MMLSNLAVEISLTIILLVDSNALAQQGPPSKIASPFEDLTFRIERQFAQPTAAKNMLKRIAFEGFPGPDRQIHKDTVAVYGDGGNTNVRQLKVEDFASAIQNFTSPEFHQKHKDNEKDQVSLVYQIEDLEIQSLAYNQQIIKEVVENEIIEMGGTIHLYISSPGVSALDNHTDITDIVVLQLDGAKEWLLCTEKQPSMVFDDINIGVRAGGEENRFSRKLDSCSVYSDFEFDKLDCKRDILYPGDALFLPRRVVHSARALADDFSAHLTFGFAGDSMCRDYPVAPERELTLGGCDCSCDLGCDAGCDWGCDGFWGCSCDEHCDSSCDNGCDSCGVGCNP